MTVTKTKMKYKFLLYRSLLTILVVCGVIAAVKILQPQKVDHTPAPTPLWQQNTNKSEDFGALAPAPTPLWQQNTNKSEDFGAPTPAPLATSATNGSFTVAFASSGFYTGPYIEVAGDITLWNRHVEYYDYSTNVVGCWKRDTDNQIFVTLMAGYGVYPSLFGDDKNRIFIASMVHNRSCINDVACLGFVPIPSKYKIGGIIEDVSIYGDPNNQKSLKVSIRKEDKWYIIYNWEKIGYIEDGALSNITDCDEIGWGGIVGSTGTTSNPTEMGNGHPPSEGYSRSGAIAAAHGMTIDGKLASGKPYIIMSNKPQCYDIKVNENHPVSTYNFLYGGSGC